MFEKEAKECCNNLIQNKINIKSIYDIEVIQKDLEKFFQQSAEFGYKVAYRELKNENVRLKKRCNNYEMNLSKMEKGACDICKETEKDRRLEELEKENEELKEQNLKDCEAFNNIIKETKKQWKKEHNQLIKAKEIIKKLYSHVFQGIDFMELNDFNIQKVKVEAFLKEVEE